MKDWKTTLFGTLTSILAMAHMSGVTVGHIGHGPGDWLGLAAVITGAATAYVAQDGGKK